MTAFLSFVPFSIDFSRAELEGGGADGASLAAGGGGGGGAGGILSQNERDAKCWWLNCCESRTSFDWLPGLAQKIGLHPSGEIKTPCNLSSTRPSLS